MGTREGEKHTKVNSLTIAFFILACYVGIILILINSIKQNKVLNGITSNIARQKKKRKLFTKFSFMKQNQCLSFPLSIIDMNYLDIYNNNQHDSSTFNIKVA